MMESDRQRWNERYRGEGCLMGERPTAFLVESLPLIVSRTPGRRALDLACGEGRNSIFLARNGFSVTGVDISEEALAKAERRAAAEGVAVEWIAADLEGVVIPGRFDLILNINFLLRDLFGASVTALSPGGLLLAETIMAGAGAPVPHNPLYLLQPGELARLFAPYPGSILLSEELPDAATPTARLIFRKDEGE